MAMTSKNGSKDDSKDDLKDDSKDNSKDNSKDDLKEDDLKDGCKDNSKTSLDSFLASYCTFCGSTFYADQGIKVLQWSLWFLSYLTSNPAKNRTALSSNARKLYFDLSMARYALRLYGFLQSLEGYRSGSWAGTSVATPANPSARWESPLIDGLARYAMAGSMLCYYPLEHLAYFAWSMPDWFATIKDRRGRQIIDANYLSAISCRFWTIYILADFWANSIKWKQLKAMLASAATFVKPSDQHQQIQKLSLQRTILNKLKHVKLQILRSFFFILPAIHWSMLDWATKPYFSETTVNGLMLAEAYTCVYQSFCAIKG